MDSNLLNNPAFANLSPEKLQFLLSFAQKEKPLNMKDAMPFLLSNMRQAKENHIDFTKPEIELLCDLLSKDLPPESQSFHASGCIHTESDANEKDHVPDVDEPFTSSSLIGIFKILSSGNRLLPFPSVPS